MNENQNRIFLLERENVKTALWKLGTPTMVGMLVSAFYNIVDAFFVGRLGILPTAAVAVVYPLTMIGTGIGALFGNGTSSYISRLLGKKAFEKVKTYSSVAIFSGLLTITITVLIMLLFFKPLMFTLGATQANFAYVKAYGILYLIGLLCNVFNMMMNNLIVAEGNSSFGMNAMLIGGLANLLLDPLLIFTFHMGVAGAAIATLLSRILSTACYLYYMTTHSTYLSISWNYWKPSLSIYKDILKIGMPICFFQILNGGAISLTNVVAKNFGNSAIAAMGIVNRIMSLETNALIGFLKGYSPLVGYNYGTGNQQRVKDVTRLALLWTSCVTILFGFLCILFAKEIISLFHLESSEVLKLGSFILRINSLSFMTLGLQIVIGNYFLAIGKSKQGGLLSICRQGLFFIPFLFIFSNLWGIDGMITAQLAADLCAAIATLWFWHQEQVQQRKRLVLVKENTCC